MVKGKGSGSFIGVDDAFLDQRDVLGMERRKIGNNVLDNRLGSDVGMRER